MATGEEVMRGHSQPIPPPSSNREKREETHAKYERVRGAWLQTPHISIAGGRKELKGREGKGGGQREGYHWADPLLHSYLTTANDDCKHCY